MHLPSETFEKVYRIVLLEQRDYKNPNVQQMLAQSADCHLTLKELDYFRKNVMN
jgi:hypothetical protein